MSVARALGNESVLSLMVLRQRTFFAGLLDQAVETGVVTQPQVVDTDINLKLETTIRPVANPATVGSGRFQLIVD